MKKIWMILIFLLNLAPNMINDKIALTTMSQLFAQMRSSEFVCQDEWGEFESDIPCDDIPCIEACTTCGAQNICKDDHECPTESCKICLEDYTKGTSHTCAKQTCLTCQIEYIIALGHQCYGGGGNSGGNNSGGGSDSGSGGNNGNGNGNNNGDNNNNSNPEDEEGKIVYIPNINEKIALAKAIATISKYSKGYTLNNSEILKLGQLLESLSMDIGYKTLLNYIKSFPISKFYIDSNVLIGGYNPYDQSIRFSSKDDIENALKEELLHHIQNMLYTNGISQYNQTFGGLSQIEFEVKVLQDILCFINGYGCPWYGATGNSDTTYSAWIISLCENDSIPSIEELFSIDPITGTTYNDHLNNFNKDPNRTNYHSPILEDLKPLLFDYLYNNQ